MTANTNLTSGLSSRALIAPTWHTIVFIAIFVGLSIIGGFFQHAVKQHPQPAAPTGNAVPGYISVVVFEWLLVLYVRMGVHKRGLRLRDLVGGRWATPKEVIKDIALGAGLWAVWRGLMSPHILGSGTNAAQGLLPQGILENLAWIPVALSAGFCEELAFRGYLQRQFQALTGNTGWAVLIQAIIFGVGHLY
jgi:membrane protease YdiL (CAAX protease family)